LFKQDKISLPLSTAYLQKLEDEERANGYDPSYTNDSSNPTTSNIESTEPQRTEIEQSSTESIQTTNELTQDIQSHRATFTETPLHPLEKRKVLPLLLKLTQINWSGLHILAPLTTLGNPPFRRLTRHFGAQLTYSEMTLSSTLLSGHRSEWALLRAHPSETSSQSISSNIHYGIQIAGSKVPAVIKTTELISKLCVNGDRTGVDTIDLNCGCPLDMVFKQGAGSALLDSQGRMVKMLRGMVSVSGDIPVTCKIRMGVNNSKNTAGKLVRRLIMEGIGVSAVTLHGRNRVQRYYPFSFES
jgi:tRNA-dihydrouridine synthase 3